MLGLIDDRLQRTVEGETRGYESAAEFVADLTEIERSLVAHSGSRIASGELADVIWRARVFGFHLAELEIRQHSSRHRAALDEIFRTTGVCGSFASLPE